MTAPVRAVTWRAFVKDRRDDAAYVVFSDGATEYAAWVATDGTIAGLRSVARSWIADRDRRIEAKDEITPGMELDLTPDAPTDPPPLPADFLAWQVKWSTYLRLARWFEEDIPSVTAERVALAKSDHEKLWDVSFEALL